MAKDKPTKPATLEQTSTREVAVDPVRKMMAETGCSKMEAIAKVAAEKATAEKPAAVPPTE